MRHAFLGLSLLLLGMGSGCMVGPDYVRPDTAVQGVIKAAAEHCSVRVGNLSTLLWGDENEVFTGLRAAFRAAQTYGPAVVTATLASGMPGDGLVEEIQTDVEKTAGGNVRS